MGWKSGKDDSRAKRSGWSGGPSSRDKPLHRWQDATSAAEGKRVRRRHHRNRWVVVTVMALGLLGCLIWLLLHLQPKSQLIVFTATEYELPIPANCWANEDGQALAALDTVNLFLTDVSEQWNRERSAKIEFDAAAIKENQSRRDTPLIVYLSMHGIVNDNGDPCLLPPGASLRDPKTWILVADVLDRLKGAVPDTRDKLLILDCNRIRVNWQLGVLYNTFVERVEELVTKKAIPRMAVMTAAGPGEASWASADLGGSVFGRYLQLGLAGAADDGGGNFFKDILGRDVTLQELTTYLQREVSAWSQFNRGEPQTPQLMPAKADFRLTWADSQLSDFEDQFKNQTAAAAAVSLDDIGKIWTKFDKLRQHDLVRLDPIACRNFEHRLLQLEEQSQGGNAYAEAAREQYKKLDDELTAALGRAEAAANTPALADRLADATWAHIREAAHTLPVSEYFGAIDSQQSQEISTLWKKLLDSSDAQNPKEIIKQSPARDAIWKLSETQLLVAAKQQQVTALWRRAPVNLTKALERRHFAEQLSVPSGTGGRPGDERAHYFARFAAKSADLKRRLADDLLFVGEKNAPTDKDYETVAAEAHTLYTQASAVMEKAAAAFTSLDQARAMTPYLAAWLCNPLSRDLAERDQLVSEASNLIKITATLSEKINRVDPGPGADSAFPLVGLADEAAANLKAMRIRFNNESKRLTTEEAKGFAGWRAIEAILVAPLISGDVRAGLLTNRNDIAAKLHEAYFTADNEKYEVAADPPSRNLEVMKEWASHPLLEILQFDDVKIEDEAECDLQAKKVRKRLQSRVALGESEEAAAITPVGPMPQARRKLSQAEHALRASASLGYGPWVGADEPVTGLRRFDLQQLLIWHAQRALDDFWDDVANPGTEKPFYKVAAQEFLQAAKRLQEPKAATAEQIQAIENRLKVNIEPLNIAADVGDVAAEAGEPVRVTLAITADPNSNNAPQGVAALYLRNKEGKSSRLSDLELRQLPSGANRFAVLRSKPSARQQFEITIPDTTDLSPTLDAIAFFRGREKTSNVQLRKIEGVLVTYEPSPYEEPTITLLGDQKQRSSIVFILDCSASMRDEFRVEGQAGDDNDTSEMKPRLELAKNALNGMLSDILRRGDDTHVGVILFGHRAAFKQKTMIWMAQPGYIDPIPKDLAPAEDVEPIHHLGRFDDTDFGQLRKRLDTIQLGWGQSPLYLALVQALAEFQRDGPDTRKSIIVITDGDNYQYLRSPTGLPISGTSKDAVLKAWRSLPVPVYILEFDKTQKATEARQLAEDTQGAYQAVASEMDLLARLRERLKVDGYEVRDAQGSPIRPTEGGAPQLTRLGEPVEIRLGNTRPQPFTVEYRSTTKQVSLEGGEAIQLRVVQNGTAQDIEADPYDPTVAHNAFLTRGSAGESTNLLFRVRPRRDKTSVVFKTSLQIDPADSHFTLRPAETWLEVTPLTDNRGTADAYVFYDRNFKNDEPVPVMEWRAINWPAEARQARIRFWCKMIRTPTTEKILLRDLLAPSSSASVNGASLSAKVLKDNNRFRVQIKENHKSTSIDSLRIRFNTDPNAELIRVNREFDSEHGVAIHTYEFDAKTANRVEGSSDSHIEITSADEIKQEALQLPDDGGIIVPIEDVNDLLFSSESAAGS